MTLLYDQTDSNLGNSADYTGKLSGVKWMTLNGSYSPTYERAYTYGYDTLSRLVSANYAERATASAGSFNTNRGGFREIESYDLMGNIQKLSRYASTPGTSSIVHIDSLAYGYLSTNPNRLNTVVDATGNSLGFYNFTGTSTGTYAYDSNGNMTTDPYKGLTTDYNVLNKTDSVIIASTGRIRYTYDASGTVIRKQQYNSSGALTTTTDYLDGFVYVNSTISYAGMPEGKVLNVGGTLKPEYIITDQQGNARISFQDNGSGVAVVTQENSYYGFGMVMPNSPVGTPTTPNKNLYNGGSEWQNDFSNLPDLMQTFYRNYDAALGRWTGTDPMAEGAADMTPYQYAGNSPIMMNDPMGNFLPIPGTKIAPAAGAPGALDPNGIEAQMNNIPILGDGPCQSCDAFHKYNYWDDPANGGGGSGRASDPGDSPTRYSDPESIAEITALINSGKSSLVVLEYGNPITVKDHNFSNFNNDLVSVIQAGFDYLFGNGARGEDPTGNGFLDFHVPNAGDSNPYMFTYAQLNHAAMTELSITAMFAGGVAFRSASLLDFTAKTALLKGGASFAAQASVNGIRNVDYADVGFDALMSPYASAVFGAEFDYQPFRQEGPTFLVGGINKSLTQVGFETGANYLFGKTSDLGPNIYGSYFLNASGKAGTNYTVDKIFGK